MPTLDIIFIVVISIMVLSVVLSIVDWIYLASLASKTALLEREVEIEERAGQHLIDRTAELIDP